MKRKLPNTKLCTTAKPPIIPAVRPTKAFWLHLAITVAFEEDNEELVKVVLPVVVDVPAVIVVTVPGLKPEFVEVVVVVVVVEELLPKLLREVVVVLKVVAPGAKVVVSD